MPREDTEDIPKPTPEELQEEFGLDNPFDESDSTRVRPITSDTDPLIGVEAGEYRILSALGAGSMGLVYKGAHQTNGRVVAIKVLKRALISDPTHARRFLDEARAVAACNHPGIIDVFSVGQLASDEPYLVMEFLEGEPLDVKLLREKRLPVDEVLELGVAIASALHAAHEVGVIHRDIKPPNIFIVQRKDATRFPKLIDFGLAQRVQEGERSEQTSIGGTPLYLAPEQARRQPITPQADLYSFGCVLFELLSGKPPFTAGNLHALLDQHASLAPMPLRALVPEVPKSLEKLVLSMLAKEPDDRPASAADVKKALEAVRAERVTPASAGPRRGAPPEDEKTTVSFVHQPRTTVPTEPDGVVATQRRAPEAPDDSTLSPHRPRAVLVDAEPVSASSPRGTLVDASADELDPAPGARSDLERLGPPVPEEEAPTTFDRKPLTTRPAVATEPEGAATSFDLEPIGERPRPKPRTGETPSLPNADPARLARLTMPTLDTGADDPLPAPPRRQTGGVDAPPVRRSTGEHRAAPKSRTGEQPAKGEGQDAPQAPKRSRTSERPAEPRPRTGEIKSPRARTGEQPTSDEAVAKEPRRALSQSNVPVAPPPASQNRLVVLVIIAAAVVVLLAIAIAVKMSGETETPKATPPPKPVVVVPPKPPEPVVEEPVVPPAPSVTADQVKAAYQKLSARIAQLPKASRASAQRQLKGLKGCSEPPEKCLQQLEKLERKLFKR